MPKFAWKCLYKQDSEYVSGPNVEILNMAKFWIWQGSHANVTKPVLTEFWIYFRF